MKFQFIKIYTSVITFPENFFEWLGVILDEILIYYWYSCRLCCLS